MTNIIVVFQKVEDAKAIRNILVKYGYSVSAVCTTGAQAINFADSLNDGIVVCGYKYTDMIYMNLKECLPPTFTMLLLASQRVLSECVNNEIVCLSMPLKTHDLVNTVEMLDKTLTRKRKKAKMQPRHRNDEEQATITEAKKILIEKHNMSETEAHRYIQKCSMDSGTNMVETAEMIIRIMMQ